MAIFTVGDEENYDKGLLEYGPDFKKLGRRKGKGYPGGFVCKTVADAQQLIIEFTKVGEWAVYELKASWEHDTTPSTNGWWHALIRDAQIVQKRTK